MKFIAWFTFVDIYVELVRLAFLFNFLQDVTGTIESNNFLLSRAVELGSPVEALELPRVEWNTAVGLRQNVGKMNQLNWNSMDSFDGQNVGYFTSSWCFGNWCLGLSWTRSSCWLRGTENGVTGNTETFIVSDVSDLVFDTIGRKESEHGCVG